MKKVVSLIVILFVMLDVFAAFNCLPSSSRGFMVEGGVGKYNNINLNMIEAAEGSAIGIPFDLEGSDVQYTTAPVTARQIGTWSIATNYSNVTIEINSTDLIHTSMPSAPAIGYNLVFHIRYATFLDDGSLAETIHEDIVVESGVPQSKNISNHAGENPFPVVSRDQDIRFFLKNGVNMSSSTYQSGYYSSTVTITVSGE